MMIMAEFDGFDWDDGNSAKSLKKHGVSREETEEVFRGGLYFSFPDHKHSIFEERFMALGQTASGKLITIAYTLRMKGGRILLRPISARPMHEKERALYEKAIAEV